MLQDQVHASNYVSLIQKAKQMGIDLTQGRDADVSKWAPELQEIHKWLKRNADKSRLDSSTTTRFDKWGMDPIQAALAYLNEQYISLEKCRLKLNDMIKE